MTNARDKANIPTLNFSSTGIDDNATSTAITIDSSENVGIKSTPSSDAWSGARTLVLKETSGDNGITIISSSATNNGNIAFADTSGGGFSDIGGLITYLHNGDSFRFMTANTERMRLNSTGLGIGTSSPDNKLHIQNGDASASSNAYSNLTIESSSSINALQFLSPNTAQQQIRFGDPQDDGNGYIAYNHSGVYLSIGVSGPERIRIDSSGNVGINQSSPGQKLDVQGIVQVKTATSSSRKFRILDSVTSQYFDIGVSISSSQPNLTFSDGADERMRIDSSGHTAIGTTNSSSGDISNFKRLSGGEIFTRRAVHTFSATNTWETVETFSSNSGTFLLTALGSGGGNPTTDNYIGFVSINGSGTNITDVKTATNVQVQMSGLNLQIRQQFFSTANITYSLLRLNH